MAKNSIGGALRLIRERLGVSIVSVARRAGISDAMLSRIERGERLSPHFTTVAKIALVLGVSLDEVAEEAGVPIARPSLARTELVASSVRRSHKVDAALRHLERAVEQLKQAQEV